MKWVAGLVLTVVAGCTGWMMGRSYERFLAKELAQSQIRFEAESSDPASFNTAESWLKDREQRRKGLPQWKDVRARLPKHLTASQIEAVKWEFFHDLLWPEMLKRRAANENQYSGTLKSFMKEASRK